MKRACTYLAVTASALAVAPLALPPSRLLIWNASASLPVGLYLLRDGASLNRGDRVAVAAPAALGRFMSARGYLPQGLPLLKQVAALPGQTVCRLGLIVTIDGQPVASARQADSRGRPLPIWHGCTRVPLGALFLLNPLSPDSFDGRYFGVLPRRFVLGRAIPLWTDEPASPGVHSPVPRSTAPAFSAHERSKP